MRFWLHLMYFYVWISEIYCTITHSLTHYPVLGRYYSFSKGWAGSSRLDRSLPLHAWRSWGFVLFIPSALRSRLTSSSHDSLGLPLPLLAVILRHLTWEIQPVLRSMCPNHLSLFVWRTSAISLIFSRDSRSSECAAFSGFTRQIHLIMALSFLCRRLRVLADTAQVSEP